MYSIREVKEQFEKAEKEQWNALFSQYMTDERVGIKKLIEQYKRKLQSYEKEQQRLQSMLAFERKYGVQYSCICGVDEAEEGRLRSGSSRRRCSSGWSDDRGTQ